MFIIKFRKLFVSISAVLVLLAIGSIAYFGVPLGIEFKGGSLTEISYTDTRPEIAVIEEQVSSLGFASVLVQPVGDNAYSIKTGALSDPEHTALVNALGVNEESVQETSFTSIGPSVGKELARKALMAIIFVSFAVVFFIAFAFRKVTEPVSSWRFGLIAIVTLLHDVIIPAGIFTALAHTFGFEIDTLFVVALLTILGLSVSDTIVVFDRIRENLKNKTYSSFAETVGQSLKQVYVRSINTSLSTILVLLALVFFGPESTRIFALMLATGMFLGVYSSIFLASPLLVMSQKKS